MRHLKDSILLHQDQTSKHFCVEAIKITLRWLKMWSNFDAERAGSRTSRTRKHSRSHLVDVYPGVMFNPISCLHTKLWWDWQSLMPAVRILVADSQVLYCLHSSWHLSVRRGWITGLQHNARRYRWQECKQIPMQTRRDKTITTTNTHIFFNMYIITLILLEYLFLKVMNVLYLRHSFTLNSYHASAWT